MKKTPLKVFDGDDYGDYGTIEAMYVRNYCLGSRVKSHSLNLYTKGSENEKMYSLYFNVCDTYYVCIYILLTILNLLFK